MPARDAQAVPLVVAHARHSPRDVCALRLDWGRLAALLGHARFLSASDVAVVAAPAITRG